MAENYGIPPEWRIDGGGIDANGAETIDLVLPFDVTLQRAEGGELRVVGLPEIPTLAGYGFMGVKWERAPGGGRRIRAQFGTSTPPPGGGAEDGEPGVQWSAQGSFRGRDIRSHPNFVRLKVLYGWDTAKQEFPAEIPTASQQAKNAHAGKASAGGDKASPMYGEKSYDDISCVLTKTYVVRTVPTSLFSSVNNIVKRPWAALGDFDDDRDFRQMAPGLDPHGNVWRVTQPYLLSPPGGWNINVYGAAALNPKKT